MLAHVLKSLGFAGVLGFALLRGQTASAQEPAPSPVPKGVEVMARGPVHEAFATPTAQPQPTRPVAKKPPLPLEEMPPEEKPEGEVSWISGYWHWDDDRNDYLWVSGCWRAKPPGREWVPGYWREQGEQWQWVPGFWTVTGPAAAPSAGQEEKAKEVTYYPEPPAPPQTVAPGPQPNPDSFYVPGHWVWNGDRYAWRPGYWARVQPGYVWVPAHYRWTPYGYVYIAGYWDLAVSRRGILYAPVVVDTVVVGPRFVYTPAYAVSDTIVLDTLFVRPTYCHYYFGDYYGPRYREWGYESCIVYSRTNYDSIVVYRTWEYRNNPSWVNIQINLHNDRYYGRAPVPPRTLVQQNTIINQTIINNNTTVVNNNVTNVLAPTSKVAAAKGLKTVPMDPTVRQQAALQARTVQQAAVQQRQQAERVLPGSPPTAPRTASLKLPPAATVPARPGVGPTSQASKPLTTPQTGGAQHTSTPGQPAGGLKALGTAAPGAQGKPLTTATTPAPGQPNALQKQAAPLGSAPPGNTLRPAPPGPGAPSGAAPPGGQRPLTPGAPAGAGPPPGAPRVVPPPQRPAPTVAPRPQPRPVPPPRRQDDRKKKDN